MNSIGWSVPAGQKKMVAAFMESVGEHTGVGVKAAFEK
jgi:hypothetical protein